MAVFTNAAAPLSQILNQPDSTEVNELESLFGDKILICTPTGYKYISFAELQKEPEDGDDYKQPHCSLCQINIEANDLFLINLKEHFKIEIRNASNAFNIVRRTLKLSPKYRTDYPRAPPAFL